MGEKFLERNSGELSERMASNIKRARAKVNHAMVRDFFEEYAKDTEGIPPQNIINYDETNLTDEPGKKKVIVKRGTKYPEKIMNSSKASVSLMMTGTASGIVLPPYVCYRAIHLYDARTIGGPTGARYNRTKSGWFDGVTFEDYFKKIILPYCRRLSVKKVLIGDNLSSHLSPEVVRLCEENNILFKFLVPNATHLLQPLDVAFFAPFKRKWGEILDKWKMGPGRNLSAVEKTQFPKLLNTLLRSIEANAPANLRAGFEKCGIYPFKPEIVLACLPPGDPTDENCGELQDSLVSYLREIRFGPEEPLGLADGNNNEAGRGRKKG